ncbi:Fe-S protein assembly co-chaperone HscB [Sandaracinus amylolyticus]|uniref:Fe-S protein assembly co-chaperone HscB n=1 Tax=Sandaracinus amylolyticus TaxID=927083 RepID=UPI001F023CE3|nr:Fe-S protein assembly co-chaperone HscB [Sandaracinus amylolyticus]UJR79837.1 Co-chaperone protein HscB [Sandaracinus amylolyticus]
MSTDPFRTLGLPARFDLDPQEIERRYRELQKALHPDRFVGASAQERRISLSKAVEVNEAYRTLRDDLARGRALLALRGHDVKDGQPADPEFLMDVMERREALSEARSARDVEKARGLAERVRRENDRARQEITTLFEREAEPARIADVLSKMRYYRRFLDEVEVIEEEALS